MAEAGAVLVRRKKHLVYRLASGKTLVLPNTPSDHRGVRNAVADLKRLLARSNKVNDV